MSESAKKEDGRVPVTLPRFTKGEMQQMADELGMPLAHLCAQIITDWVFSDEFKSRKAEIKRRNNQDE